MRKLTLAFVFVAIFTMVATVNAQFFAPGRNGEVSALTSDVLSLMERADKVIVETTQNRLNADRKVIEAENELKKVLANKNATLIQVVEANTKYINAVTDAESVRRPAGEAIHEVAMVYFGNVNAIFKAGSKLAKDGYGEWRTKTQPITLFNYPSEYNSLMEQAKKAQKSAQEKDEKMVQQLRSDLDRMLKCWQEMHEQVSK